MSAQARILDFELAGERRALTSEVTIAWTRTRSLAPIAELRAATLGALTEQARAIEREYENGLLTLTELIEVRREEFQGQLAEIDARYELLRERLKLLRLTARLVDGQ